MQENKILVINPGSTSTKVAVFMNDREIFSKTIVHLSEDLELFKTIAAQYVFRKNALLAALSAAQIDLEDIDIVMARGGMMKPVASGIYEVTPDLLADLQAGVMGQHASNLGGILANDLAKQLPNAKAFIADPVVVDELQEVARISGLPEMPHRSVFHALNQKSVARKYADEANKDYESVNLIVAHLGGGITIGAHLKGRVVDVNNGLDGSGPFAPERAGTLPTGRLVEECFSGKYTLAQMQDKIAGKGGLMAQVGTNQVQNVRALAAGGDSHAALVLEAMSYQIGKGIGSAAAVLHGDVDAIIITGGIAYEKEIVWYIKSMVNFIAPVVVIPGEDEMRALAENALLILTHKLLPKEY